MTLRQRVVFCDFDGTISADETFKNMLERFSPDLAAELMPALFARELTLRQGVRQMLEAIPSERYPEVVASATEPGLRPGFVELLDFLDEQEVPLVVVSGGLVGMIEAALGDLVRRVLAIHAIEIDSSGPRLSPSSEFEADDEMVAKVRVTELYPARQRVAIGDSVTDINLARAADLVFARDRLCGYLDAEGGDYQRWQTFFDVRDELSRRWRGPAGDPTSRQQSTR